MYASMNETNRYIAIVTFFLTTIFAILLFELLRKGFTDEVIHLYTDEVHEHEFNVIL